MQQSKEERVHSVFEKIYGNYDKMNSVISFQQHLRWRKDTMKKMNVQKGSKALDVCCGTADWSIALAEAVGENGKVVGLDFSKNMLKIGEEKIKDRKLKQVELVHGNAMELPFADNSFDYVTIGFGLRNVPDYLQVLKEMHRVAKPGGIAVCLETSQPTLFGYKQAYYFYFRFIMPMFGKLFAKSFNEYSWLQESARDFPGMKELAGMFEEAGFKNVTFKPYSGGVAAVHIGTK
ncbi:MULTISPECIES: demethylmenaquinone methyltransferase [Cytobacillus]|jgi:demethylmenaquinone methyltransferase / 2-methoxy-6-polyprenyl-1,4-benzoquinol methylase|uniref:Demethylmenaquinone methyltransferase n=3 Tax=Cytobacillus TaxID=2675230 RepID=A0A160MDV9_9BACI|nr:MULTISPECIES: demethylmenaquinone methyltransferase [Cytobacillus]EFV77589.1 ubiquinone/menaquinone biosynthesis methyltransferase [Bacillus sp. 2_A_57_CT2]MBY0154704.1 demethylmenaquinone methyltransferase [Cytobacillus firmus]AND41242.1 bifunctional demethylmenaquinone methyltransferase/2-methoxy-6-polyprenyl-1,4-benzoquinol methylase [Cytobacillus oceanisediminis 2691]MBU8733571.1 demethylmenaquinone methyltransferase [Cytobacillus oceanisediminis]MCM3243600.1 demethylmenaquinone methylt